MSTACLISPTNFLAFPKTEEYKSVKQNYTNLAGLFYRIFAIQESKNSNKSNNFFTEKQEKSLETCCETGNWGN